MDGSRRSQTRALPIIVVPDGLAVGPDGEAGREPSFAFRASLDRIVERYRDRRVLIAPANDFGSGASEQEVAATYLRARGVADPLAPPSPPGGYLDTRANARELRRHLERTSDWPIGPVRLVVARPHARRAALCFRREGFEIAAVDAVSYRIPPGERVPRRLWYYRHPGAHLLYETAALLRDLVRR